MSHFIRMEITIKIENNTVESNPNISIEDLSTKIHRRVQSIEKLLKAAEIVNDGWIPDWDDYLQYKYFITIVRSMGQNVLCITGTTELSNLGRLVYFKSRIAVKQVVDLLGEETIMNALVFE